MHAKGRIEVICGPMFSGKSTELIRLVDRLTIAAENCVIFKPKIDNRYIPNKVCTHSRMERECRVIEKATEIKKYLKEHKNISVVAIDEAQFFDTNLSKLVYQLAEAGYEVLVAGLDKDFKAEPFGPMKELVCMAEYVHKLTAVCNVCGEEATFTQRIVGGEPAGYNSEIIVVGEAEKYQARCKDHFIVPGKPGITDKDIPMRTFYKDSTNIKVG